MTRTDAHVSRPAAAAVFFRLLRVPEWAKNAFVFAPLVFSGLLTSPRAVQAATLTAVAFCAAASAVYVFNDLIDAERDRSHPKKRLRPIAAGIISRPAACAIAVLLAVLGIELVLAARVPASVLALAVAFLLVNLAYSLFLKQKVIADVLAIAVGYVLRVLAGGTAIGVEVTPWLLLCTFLLATFLGFSKRRHELVQLGSGSREHRPVLSLYTEPFLDQMSLLTLGMTLTCYILYTIAPETVARFGTGSLVYSSLIVMFALFRYLFLLHVKKMGSPTEVLYYDRQIVLAIVVWLVYVVAVVYTGPALAGFIR